MPIFYDWRDRTGKGWKPWREEIKELRSPLFIAMGIVLFLVLVTSGIVYFCFSRPYLCTRSETKSEKVYLLPDPPKQRVVIPETGSRAMQNVKGDDRLDLDSTRKA